MEYLTVVFNAKPMKRDFAESIIDTCRRMLQQKEHKLIYIVRHRKNQNELVHAHALISFEDIEDLYEMDDFLNSYQTRFYFIKTQRLKCIKAYFHYIHHEMTTDEVSQWAKETMYDRKIIFFNKKSIELFENLKKNYLTSILGISDLKDRPERSGGPIE